MSKKLRIQLKSVIIGNLVLALFMALNFRGREIYSGHGNGSDGFIVMAGFTEYGWPCVAYWKSFLERSEHGVIVKPGLISEQWIPFGIAVDFFSILIAVAVTVVFTEWYFSTHRHTF